MKNYFLSFEFWNRDGSKHWFTHCTFACDKKDFNLDDMCRLMIKRDHPDFNTDELIIKVNSFNNIELP